MNYKKILTIFTVLFGLFIFKSGSSAVFAQYYSIDLETPGQTVNVNDTFNVKIYINTEDVEAINGDVLLNFDPQKINILSSTSNNFFTFAYSTYISGSNNQYLASSWEESIAHAKSSNKETPFYTLSVKALESGSTQISFDCTTGSEADTNINRSSDSEDVVKCPLEPLTLNIGASQADVPTQPPSDDGGGGGDGGGDGGGGSSTTSPTSTPRPTLTPTFTPTPTATDTPTPTQNTNQVTELPRAGVIEDTVKLLGAGSLLTIIGLLFML